MPALRRFVVRIRCEGRKFAGVLEDAHTGLENPFASARELVSLLARLGSVSFRTGPPQGGLSTTKARKDARHPRRVVTGVHRHPDAERAGLGAIPEPAVLPIDFDVHVLV